MKSRDYAGESGGSVEKPLPGRLFVPLQCGSSESRRRSGAAVEEEPPRSGAPSWTLGHPQVGESNTVGDSVVFCLYTETAHVLCLQDKCGIVENVLSRSFIRLAPV